MFKSGCVLGEETKNFYAHRGSLNTFWAIKCRNHLVIWREVRVNIGENRAILIMKKTKIFTLTAELDRFPWENTKKT